MLFNSMHFAVFFVAVTAAFFAIPVKLRPLLLLGASYYFYMSWEPGYAVLIIFTTLVCYACARGLERATAQTVRKVLLAVGVSCGLGVLFVFKYFNFVGQALRDALGLVHVQVDWPLLEVLLPVGISFYTFQGIGYMVDVYRRNIPAERSLQRFALFKVFYPQLVAGPIERAGNLLPQMALDKPWDTGRVWSGLQLMLWGLFKKVVIADRAAIYVDAIYNDVAGHSGPTYLLATYLFAFQIYCDFSGYSDIAIGSARVLGVDLMQNFRRPYFATTIPDFWRRWHISLSTWLRDYLYIPLGGNRQGVSRMYLSLMITMFLGGIWHGANWTFLIWGLLQGVMLCASKATLPARDALVARLGLPWHVVQAWRMVVTFHLVCLSWVFFRANTAGDAFYILTHLFDGWPRLFFDGMVIWHVLPAILLLLIVQVLQSRGSVANRLRTLPAPARLGVYVTAVFSIVLFGADFGSQFIYFQF